MEIIKYSQCSNNKYFIVLRSILLQNLITITSVKYHINLLHLSCRIFRRDRTESQFSCPTYE